MLVLDTNVVLDLLYFDDAVSRPLRQALEAGRVRCGVSEATLEEWRRVLAYPGFALDAVRQATLFARYQALSEMTVSDGVAPGLPHCSDPDDQKFLELAAAAGAEVLVSKDHALLKLNRRCRPHFRIMDVAGVVRWLADAPA
jgi:putative PIN family toxin of toxin-antitoxin system